MEKWVKIESSEQLIQLELLKNSLLENCGIQAVIINKKISGYGLGVAELFVSQEDELKARAYLATL